MPRLVLLLLLFPAAVWSQTQADNDAIFSRTAISIWSSNNVLIPSPDGKKAIIVKQPEQPDGDETHTVLVRAAGHMYRTTIGALVNAEVAWSPDSKAFFVTYSDGGNVGTYHVRVVYVTTSGLRVIEPVPNGSRLFTPTCFDAEIPNVGAIGWVGKESNQLVVAVQVPPHSSCASMSTFRAFVIRLPDGGVMSRYGQIEAKRVFSGQIGSMLKDADDICIEKPNTCVPCGMKGGACSR